MKIVFNIKEIFITSLLIITLALPSFIQFSHQLSESHDFSLCEEQKAHIHENNVHCDACVYHFSNFIYKVIGVTELIAPPIFSKNTLGSTTPLCNYAPLTNKLLRGPPSFSYS
jgi:hypothetical protein